jgi:cell division protein FtsA
MNRAEQLKLEHGALEANAADETISLKREVGLPDRQVSRQRLCRIMHMRIEETLGLIRKELEKQQLLDYLGAGVFITGGCARLRGLEPLAAQVFGLPVHLSHGSTVGGPTSAIESPEYSTAIGLVRYALCSQRDQHRAPTKFILVRDKVHHLITKIRSFL